MSLAEQAERALPDYVLVRMVAHGSLIGPFYPDPPLLVSLLARLFLIPRRPAPQL